MGRDRVRWKGQVAVGRDRDRVQLGGTACSWEGQGALGKDRERWGGTASSWEGQGEVWRDRERLQGQGEAWRDREEWGGIVGTFLPSPFLHSVSGACVLVHGGS